MAPGPPLIWAPAKYELGGAEQRHPARWWRRWILGIGVGSPQYQIMCVVYVYIDNFAPCHAMPCIHPSIHVRTVQSQNVKCSPGPAKSRVKGIFTCSGAGVQPNDAGQGRWSWEVHEWLFMSQQRPTGCHSDSMNRKWL